MSDDFAPPSASRFPRSRAATREVWLDRMARYPTSGLTVPQFCAIEAVSVPSFYSWKRRLAAETHETTTTVGPGNNHPPRLLPVRLPPSDPAVELVLPTGAVLRLPLGCDLAWVRSLVAALGDASC
jgi:hypothetical protein